MKKLLLFVLALTLLVTACGPEPPPERVDSGADAGADVADVDEDVDDQDTADASDASDTDSAHDTEDDVDSCTPQTACDESDCGMVDDGCGGTLDCGTCRCEGGNPTQDGCGECGLGTLTCAADETGAGTCASPDLPGIDATASESVCNTALIFVDSTVASSGDGSKSSPYATYADAAQAATAGKIIILGASEAYDEPIELENGVSVIGGFGASPTFAYTEGARSTIEPPAPSGGDVFGLRGESITDSTTVANLDITTPDAPAQSDNYGAYLTDSPGVTFRNIRVTAGEGGVGLDGGSGSDGGDGSPGEDANESPAGVPEATSPGTNSSCPAANGGAGGEGSGRLGTNILSPKDGADSPGGAAGGDAAAGSINATARTGQPGADGTNVADGDPGDGGVSGGSVEAGLWVSEGAGSKGANGPHGIGGGGGGAAWFNPNECQSAFYYPGPSGASGGAGGCGGEGGEGGGPGGASFGLMLVRSDITVEDSEFSAGIGGRGGNAGTGGRGGSGAAGGSGSNRGENLTCTPTYDIYSWSSGDGGDGSDGGNGGAGGGGAGGVSYGVYCFESAPSVDDVTSFEAGGAAAGGSGGNSGNPGVSTDVQGCN